MVVEEEVFVGYGRGQGWVWMSEVTFQVFRFQLKEENKMKMKNERIGMHSSHAGYF
jgi:hypothetical protein